MDKLSCAVFSLLIGFLISIVVAIIILPILRKKERKQKQILSYIIITSEILIAIFIKNTTISGIIIFGDLIQTLTITRIAYKVTHNKYGHEVYAES